MTLIDGVIGGMILVMSVLMDDGGACFGGDSGGDGKANVRCCEMIVLSCYINAQIRLHLVTCNILSHPVVEINSLVANHSQLI